MKYSFIPALDQKSTATMTPMENTSGKGHAAIVPTEIERWNWGAFFWSWIWGIGNNTLIALLAFVPFVNFIMPFVLGAKGSEWAWRNKRWESVQQFQKVQRQWAKWGCIVWLLTILFVVVLVFGSIFIVFAILKNSQAYTIALSRVEASPQVAEVVGSPVSAGLPTGSLKVSGESGQASLSFSVEGPKGGGTVYVEATKALGEWKLNQLVFEHGITGARVDLLVPQKNSRPVKGPTH